MGLFSGNMKWIRDIVSKFLQVEFIRFGIVGVIATIIHYVIYWLLNSITNYNVAYTIGYLVSFLCNFWLTAKFTFKSTPTPKKGLGFALSHCVNYGLQILVLNIAVRLGVAQQFAPIPVYIICIPINFLLVRFVFKKV